MAFCTNCGKEIPSGGKFCASCGSPAVTNAQETRSERKVEYVGKVKKCPSCGEEIKSFTAICPACGHELNSSKSSDTLTSFIKQIEFCERLIADNQSKTKTGWSSWKTSKKVWWVIFNLFFACIPLVVYMVMPLIKINSTPKLSREEKQLASLIENFPFPNDRESILEALVFAKEKIDFISSEKVDRKSAYWMRLWSSKAEQLKQKADLMFPNDPVVKSSFDEILADKSRVKKTLQMKAIAGVVILVVAIAFILIRGGALEDIKMSNTPLIIPETELSVLIPQIEDGKGEIVTNNEYHFTVEYYGISEQEFEDYKKMCKDMGFTIDCESTGSLFDAFNEDGYNIRITYYDRKMHVGIDDKMDMGKIVWPDTKVADLLPKPKSDYGQISSASDSCVILYIGNMTIEDYKDYVNECMEKGFNKDVSQTSDHFHADDKKGNGVMVEYRGFNTVFIRIDD